MILYHGSDAQFSELRADSYATPHIHVAREYGSLIYAFEGTPDADEYFELGGRLYLSPGATKKGTTTRVQVDSFEGFEYVITHVPHQVRLVENNHRAA